MTRFPRSTPILLAALALGAVACRPVTARAQRDARTRIDTTFAFSKGGWVDLGLVSGEIIVTGWTRTEAHVIARLERDGYLDASLSSDRIRIETRSRRRRQGEGRYELMVPIGTRVHASAVSGDIRITATAGEVEASTVSGKIEVLDAAVRIEIGTVSGDIHAERLRGRTHIHAVSGDLETRDITGDLSAETVNGEIKLRNVKSSNVRAGTVSGEITYVGTIDPAGSYDFNSHSGEVRLEIPSNAGATLNLQTFSGSITSRFPIAMQPGQISRRGRQQEFTIGGGGARITIETFSGDITLERGARSGRED
jgi:predicted DNA-binding protein with PD1-like motif